MVVVAALSMVLISFICHLFFDRRTKRLLVDLFVGLLHWQTFSQVLFPPEEGLEVVPLVLCFYIAPCHASSKETMCTMIVVVVVVPGLVKLE